LQGTEADGADQRTIHFFGRPQIAVLTGKAPLKQKCDPNHEQDGRPQNGFAHVPLSIRLQGQGDSDKKEKRPRDGAMEGPVLGQIDEARQTHCGEESRAPVLLKMQDMQDDQPETI